MLKKYEKKFTLNLIKKEYFKLKNNFFLHKKLNSQKYKINRKKRGKRKKEKKRGKRKKEKKRRKRKKEKKKQKK